MLKYALFALVVSGFLGYYFSTIYVIDGFEKPYVYKGIYAYLNLIGNIAKLSGKLGIAPEYAVFRRLNDLFNFPLADRNHDGVKIYDIQIENVSLRIYSPLRIDKPTAFMVYFHGGGFIMGNKDIYDKWLFTLAEQLGISVFSVGYRLVPEHPYPIPTNDCWFAVEYILKNAQKYNIDVNKMIFGGDSAGGNAAIVTSFRAHREENTPKPILQVLIYPWVQLTTVQLPSLFFYQGGLMSSMSYPKIILWYLGVTNTTMDVEQAIISNNHTLILNEKLRKKVASYLDVNLIPEKYKTQDYYRKYHHLRPIKPGSDRDLDQQSVLKTNQNLVDKINTLYSDEVSPCLADEDKLRTLPQTYSILCEWDGLKDENLIFVERLRQANVQVDVAFYDKCYHAMIPFIDPTTGFELSNQILHDLIGFLRQRIF